MMLHCQHKNDFCIKMGSDESHLNFSLIARDKVIRQCPQTATFLKKKESRRESIRGPSAYLPIALPLGQNGSALVRGIQPFYNVFTRCHPLSFTLQQLIPCVESQGCRVISVSHLISCSSA